MDFGVVAEGTPCGKGVMVYFWSHSVLAPHSQVQEGHWTCYVTSHRLAITGQSTMSSPCLLSGPVSSWVKRRPGWITARSFPALTTVQVSDGTVGKKNGHEASGC